MISARSVRLLTIGVCVAGIAGMIVTSALDHNGVAITFGIVTAVAILCSMVATSVATDTIRRAHRSGASSDALAAIVEERVVAMVAAGADEQSVRQLVGEAVRLGRTLGEPPS